MELRADFQQFYGLNLDDMGDKYTYFHAGILTEQLPRESRMLQKEEPALAWSSTDALLSGIEYWTHCLAYSYSKDAKYHRNQPQPIKPPTKKKKEKSKTIDVEELKRFLALPRKEVTHGD